MTQRSCHSHLRTNRNDIGATKSHRPPLGEPRRCKSPVPRSSIVILFVCRIPIKPPSSLIPPNMLHPQEFLRSHWSITTKWKEGRLQAHLANLVSGMTGGISGPSRQCPSHVLETTTLIDDCDTR